MAGRNFTRVSYSAGASVKYGSGIVFCKTDNVSLNGIYLKTARSIPLNEPVTVTIYHTKQSSIKVAAHVVRREADGLGLQISSLDARSFAQLRDIVADASCDCWKVLQETYGMLKCIH